MKTRLLTIILAVAAVFTTKAQVDDISVIITPTVGYNWFDKKSTIDEGVMYGIQAGFGFGKFIELRGIYERSVDLKQQFGHYQDEIQNVFPNFEFKNKDIKVNRIGGEFKTNVHVDGLSPYILLGTGVQTFEWELDKSAYKNQNIYGSAGLGFKINLSNRVTLNLEGRGVVYNMNPGSLLYDPAFAEDPDNPSFGSWIGDKSKNRMYNWSASAGLQFYFGGRNDSHLSAVDRAYLRRFSGDMSGFKLTLAPVVAYVDFNDNSNFRNTYFAGAQVGFDLSQYVGLKGYFLQSKEDDKLNLKFDKLSMYGVDFVGKLNVPRGIVPFITVGAGYIDVHEDYEGRVKISQPKSQYFAKGGLGLDIPLGKYVDVFGSVNLMFTADNENNDFTELIQPDRLKQHRMYNAGLRLKLGKHSETDYALDQVYHDRYDSDRIAYSKKIDELEKELKVAYDNNDIEKATRVIEEKKNIELRQRGDIYVKDDAVVIITPDELEKVVDKAIKNADESSSKNLEERLKNLEQLLIDLNKKYEVSNSEKEEMVSSAIKESEAKLRSALEDNKESIKKSVEKSESPEESDQASIKAQEAANEAVLNEIKKLNEQLSTQKKELEIMRSFQDSLKISAVTDQMALTSKQPEPVKTDNLHKSGKVYHSDYGVIGGVNFGQATTFNVGIRQYVSYSNSRLVFMPEAYFAFGDKKGFGISANGILPLNFKKESNFSPYAGIGLGLNRLNKEWSLNPNFIAGADYQTAIGNFFADYTVRGAFKNNQIAVGYRFKF